MDNVFASVKDFRSEYDVYVKFIKKIQSTIVELLEKTGPIEIDDDEEYAFKYHLLDYEDDFIFKKIEAKDGTINVTAVDPIGWNFDFDFNDINCDMCILEALLLKCFEVYEKKEKEK